MKAEKDGINAADWEHISKNRKLYSTNSNNVVCPKKLFPLTDMHFSIFGDALSPFQGADRFMLESMITGIGTDEDMLPFVK